MIIGKSTHFTFAAILIAAGFTAVERTVDAANIGVNFIANATNNLAPADAVGATGQTGWYNNVDVVTSNPGTVTLKDNTGSDTTAQLTIDPNGHALNGIQTAFWTPWNGGGDTTGSTAMQKLYNGHVGTANSHDRTQEFVITDIPYEHYEIYVYIITSVYQSGSAQLYVGGTAAGAQSPFYFAKGLSYWGAPLPTTYTQATGHSVADQTLGANYVLFTNLTGSDQTIDINSSTDPSLSGSISIGGLEIIETPEPATFALLAVGGLLVGATRRRHA